MKRFALAATATAALLSGALVSAPADGTSEAGAAAELVSAAARPRFDYLEPGRNPSLVEKVPVNVVLVGYGRGEIGRRALVRRLPRTSKPVVISRLGYGVRERLGITYRYRYNVVDARKRYENRFFRTLKRLADPAPLTLFQTDYNAQSSNARTVRRNHTIDAPTVERWLARNAPRGVNTRRNTVYLINWFGRSDFRVHVYTKTDEPDPDTGYNFGVIRESRKIVAWGGTTAQDEENGLGSTRRVWFHDLSAGPESWSGSWNVDDADIDGDGEPDYRIPVAWEYGSYRPARALTGDLAKLTRYVALNLLFTSSPIYPVELPTAEIPRTVDVDSNTYEGWPGVDASAEYLKPRLIRSELQELVPNKRLSYDRQDLPYRGKAKQCYEGWVAGVSCYPGTDFPPFANLYLQNFDQLARTQDDGASVDYELPVFNYALDDETAPILGFADDNYVDGTQTGVFNFISPGIVELGYGLSTTQIHEVGHHLGLSHPHDGYDSERGFAYGPSGDFYFAWAGDESNSMMSYIDLNWDFSQFDRDNMDRFQAAAFVEGANRLAAEALAADHPRRAFRELRQADRWIGRAEQVLAHHRYAAARGFARGAYLQALKGAEDAGVDIDRFLDNARVRDQAARESTAVHQPGEFIDTLEEGPRIQP